MEGFFQPEDFRIRTLRLGLKSAQSVIIYVNLRVLGAIKMETVLGSPENVGWPGFKKP